MKRPFVGLVVGGSVVFGACGLSLEIAPGEDPDAGTEPGHSSSSSSSSSGVGPGDAQPEASSSGQVPPIDAGPCADAPLEPACIDEALAVFVQAGATGTEGTRAAPFGLVSEALAKRGGKALVFVCGGDYDDVVKVSGAPVTIAGGLDCTSWQLPDAGAVPTRITAPADQPALEVDGVAVHVENLELVARDASPAPDTDGGPGHSSIAAWVHGGSLTAVASRFAAGDGGPGHEGAHQPDAQDGAKNGLGDLIAPSACGALGGRGGAQATDSATGTDAVALAGARGCPWVAADVVQLTCVVGPPTTYNTTAYLSCGDGTNGLGGPGGLVPAAATTMGALAATGWVPARGNSGTDGKRGGGGGGGGQAAVDDLNDVGGAGGNGGCPGLGGGGGGGGGASIAVLVQNATFRATATTLATADGGDGGQGGHGGDGGDGGDKLDGVGKACNGGRGGGGGGGSGGQGGAGGLVAGIVFEQAASVSWNDTPVTTTTPALTGVTLGTPGAGGLQGVKGIKGTRPSGNDGADGASGVAGATFLQQAAFRVD